MEKNNIKKFGFFGTDSFSVVILDELRASGHLPSVIITRPDKPKGRGLKLTPPPAKVWAEENKVPALQPEKLRDSDFLKDLKARSCELFVVASYGKIIPEEIINLPSKGTVNVHPSLLPKYRGPSPIQGQILNDEKEVGVTIMLIDEETDHGPVLAQKSLKNEHLKASKLAELLAHEGGKLLAETMSKWIAGEIKAVPQEHDKATYVKMIEKEDALIDLNDDPHKNYLKILAYDIWPRAYFFADRGGKKIRVIVTDAEFKDGALTIKKVIPEGKKEMNYEDFLKG